MCTLVGVQVHVSTSCVPHVGKCTLVAFLQTIPPLPFHSSTFYNGFDAMPRFALVCYPGLSLPILCYHCCMPPIAFVLAFRVVFAALLSIVVPLSGVLWLVSLFCRDFLAIPCYLPLFRCATLIVSRLPLVAIYAHSVLSFLVCRDFLTYYDKLFSLLNG